MDREDALLRVLEITVRAVTYGTIDELRRTLKLRKEDVRQGLEHLVETGRIGKVARKGKEDLYHLHPKGGS
jgi:hypothetical protein